MPDCGEREDWKYFRVAKIGKPIWMKLRQSESVW